MKDTSLAIRRGSKLEFVLYTGHSRHFRGFHEDVKFAIRGLTSRHLIIVDENEDHDLVLGQAFLNSIRFGYEYKLYRIFDTITHP